MKPHRNHKLPKSKSEVIARAIHNVIIAHRISDHVDNIKHFEECLVRAVVRITNK